MAMIILAGALDTPLQVRLLGRLHLFAGYLRPCVTFFDGIFLTWGLVLHSYFADASYVWILLF